MITDSHRVGLVGKNGSGKTTFLKILANQLKPSKGKIDIDPHKAKIVYHTQIFENFLETNNDKEDVNLEILQSLTAFEFLMSQSPVLYDLWQKVNNPEGDSDYVQL